MTRFHGLLALATLLSSCAQTPSFTEADLSGPTAVFHDTSEDHDGRKATVYYISKVDGQRIKNVASIAGTESQGRGFNLTIGEYHRVLPAREMRLTIEAHVITGAPIHAIFGHLSGSFRTAGRTVVFTPAADGKYRIRGDLKSENTDVWIENLATSEKIR
jgi:hypothetical protein